MSNAWIILTAGWALGQFIRVDPTEETKTMAKDLAGRAIAGAPKALAWFQAHLKASPTDQVQALIQEAHRVLDGEPIPAGWDSVEGGGFVAEAPLLLDEADLSPSSDFSEPLGLVDLVPADPTTPPQGDRKRAAKSITSEAKLRVKQGKEAKSDD